MRIAICDDEKELTAILKATINRVYPSLDVIVDEFNDGRLLLSSFPDKKYDIVFLDIEMPGIDGLTVAGQLRTMSDKLFLVFLTSHIEYALEGYKFNALRYLTKPPTDAGIREVIDYVIRMQGNEKFLWVKNAEGEFRVRLSDILFIEAQDQKVMIYTVSGALEQRGKLNDFENRLGGEGFFRIHRSYLVSLTKVTGIRGRDVFVAGGYSLPLGRTKESEFRSALVAAVNKEAF